VQAVQYVYGRNGKVLQPGAGTNTNDLGEYQMMDFPPGRYYFRVMVPPRMRNFETHMRRRVSENAYPDIYYPNVSLLAQATATQVGPGAQLTNIDFHMRKAPAFHIRGKAVDENGQPVHDIVLQILPGEATFFFGSHPVQLRQDGTFDARGIVSGPYVLLGNESVGNEFNFARESISVGDADVDGVLLVFRKPIEVSGTIQFNGPAPKETSQIQVNLESVDVGYVYTSSSNNAQGTFSQKVTPGTYRVNVSRAPRTYVKSMRFGEQDASSGKITLTQASDGSLNIVMGTDVGELQGSVQNENGEPAAGAIIIVAPTGELQERMDLFYQMTTDANGKFEYQDFAPGEYKVFAWAASADQEVLESLELRKAFESKATPVTIEPSGHASVQLKLISAAEIEAEKNKRP